MKEYGVFQQIISAGKILQETLCDDGFSVLESAQKLAEDFQKRNTEDFSDLNLPDGMHYEYVAKEVAL